MDFWPAHGKEEQFKIGGIKTMSLLIQIRLLGFRRTGKELVHKVTAVLTGTGLQNLFSS